MGFEWCLVMLQDAYHDSEINNSFLKDTRKEKCIFISIIKSSRV